MSAPLATPPIRFYIDCANKSRVEPWLKTGLFSGVTTNPQILRKDGLTINDIADFNRWARDNGAEETFFQVWGKTSDEQYASAMKILEMAPGATIKVPVSPVGAATITRLRNDDIPVLMTAVYSAKQSLVGSALGVQYIAPYFNRMFREGRNAVDEVRKMTTAIPQDGSGPMIMAASIKSAQHLVTMTDLGVRVFTISVSIIEDLFRDDLTDKAIRDFEESIAAIMA